MIKKVIITIESIALVVCLSILGNLYNKYSYFLLTRPYESFILDKSFENKLSQIDNVCNNLIYFKKDNKLIEKEMYKGYMRGLGDKYADYMDNNEYAIDMIRKSANISTPSYIPPKKIDYNVIDNDIGFITVKGFYTGIYKEFIGIIDRLYNCKGLIIDLRNNGGGNVDDCIRMLDYLIEESKPVEQSLGNLLYYELNREGTIINTRHTEDKHRYDKPIIILVNKDTASASELFAQCLRDYDKCIIIGEQTFGKAVEQMTYLLADGSAIKLTVAAYRTPSMIDLQGIGIKPDYEVLNEIEQLEKAIELIRKN